MSLGSPRRRAVASALATALPATLTPAAPATAATAAGPSSTRQAAAGTVKVRGQAARPRSFTMARLRLVVTATGSDGYRAALAWAELDPIDATTTRERHPNEAARLYRIKNLIALHLRTTLAGRSAAH